MLTHSDPDPPQPGGRTQLAPLLYLHRRRAVTLQAPEDKDCIPLISPDPHPSPRAGGEVWNSEFEGELGKTSSQHPAALNLVQQALAPMRGEAPGCSLVLLNG